PAGSARTMRVDYYHTGNNKQELFSLDEVSLESAAWPGRVAHPVDAMNFGAYGFDVRDRATSTLLYSEGFGSIFDEWSTTDEATKMTRTFSESVRFPAPESPVTLTIRKRDAANSWHDVWSASIDPKDM